MYLNHSKTLNKLKIKTLHFILLLAGLVLFMSCKEQSPSHHYKNGSAKFQLQNFSGAIEDFNLAIELDEEYADAYYSRAICYTKLEKTGKALTDFNKVIELNPEFKDAYLNRAFYGKEKTGDFEGAISDYNKFIDLNVEGNNSFAYNNRGYSKYKMKNFTGAFSDIEQAIQLDPSNSYAFKNLALVCIAVDSIDMACENLSKSLELGYSEKYDSQVNELIDLHCQN